MSRQLKFYKEIKYPLLKRIWASKHTLSVSGCLWPSCTKCLPQFECNFCEKKAQSYGTMVMHVYDSHITEPSYLLSGKFTYKQRVLR